MCDRVLRDNLENSPDAFFAQPMEYLMLSGRYQHDPKQNNWHEGELKQEGDKHSPSFRWINQAGVSWALTCDLVQARLLCAKESPYFGKETGSNFIIEMQPPSEGVKPAIAGFHFNGDFYKRIGD